MHKKCRPACGGNLIKIESDNIKLIQWECEKCGRIVTQRKRRCNKLDAERDMEYFQERFDKLIEKNPLSDKNKDEWNAFLGNLEAALRKMSKEVFRDDTLY